MLNSSSSAPGWSELLEYAEEKLLRSQAKTVQLQEIVKNIRQKAKNGEPFPVSLGQLRRPKTQLKKA